MLFLVSVQGLLCHLEFLNIFILTNLAYYFIYPWWLWFYLFGTSRSSDWVCLIFILTCFRTVCNLLVSHQFQHLSLLFYLPISHLLTLGIKKAEILQMLYKLVEYETQIKIKVRQFKVNHCSNTIIFIFSFKL